MNLCQKRAFHQGLNKKFDYFKIHLVDVGLLGAMSDLSAKALIDGNDLFTEFKGAYTENFIAQELINSQFALYYWSAEGRAFWSFNQKCLETSRYFDQK